MQDQSEKQHSELVDWRLRYINFFITYMGWSFIDSLHEEFRMMRNMGIGVPSEDY